MSSIRLIKEICDNEVQTLDSTQLSVAKACVLANDMEVRTIDK